MRITINRNEETSFADVYQELSPLFEQAWREVRKTGDSFDFNYKMVSMVYSANVLTIWSCYVDDTLCGYVVLSPNAQFVKSSYRPLTVVSIFVKPEFRNGKAFKAMLKECKSYASSHGYSDLLFSLSVDLYGENKVRQASKIFGKLLDYTFLLPVGD